MSQLLDFLLPAEDHDAHLVLVLPPEAAGERARSKARCPFDAKRRKSSKAAIQRRMALPANSTTLKTFSQKFRDWAARWTEGDAREYVVQCRDEAEVATYRQLLAFMHSMAKELPQDPMELLGLLVLAREHAVEAAVMGCVQRLQGQANGLPATACMGLWSALGTGVSGEAAIQAAADKLAEACFDRLCTLVQAEGALQDAVEQRALLQLLGPLQDMLNDERLRKLWRVLPLALLRDCVLEDGNVQADTEATVLAACLHWAEGREGMTTEQLSELLCRIRFPSIPAATLLTYHRTFKGLQLFDPDRELLLRAITAPELWAGLHAAMASDAQSAEAAALKAKCERWWQPREAPLAGQAAPAIFDFKCSKPERAERCVSDAYYWNGYHWSALVAKQGNDVGVFLVCSVGRKHTFQAWGCAPVTHPSAAGREALSWDAFWGDASPYCRDGAVRGRFALSVPKGS
ncbi:Kelch 8 [Micractinium conductrix]|uniref:Kelch 8 n=1 Tax=Micractinium conductrix TaxID=554055 RepID=A0A2P6VAL5_9CHLO|nr:Kelch 8 [Micractinium conductrix]|eukprot:PSC71139.1 Kelch 8 [Micractinium conductrix]